MTDFKLTRNRDAWFVVRGYKYQIDLSIQRWLSLCDGQELMLEFGEDIDVINKSLLSPVDRELEQVKHLDTPVTLNSPECKVALANAVDHFSNNAELDLLFRFSTNASVTTERTSPFRDKRAGIEVWEELRTRKTPEAERLNRIQDLMNYINGFSRPDKGIKEEAWNTFKATVSRWTASDFDAFFGRFEWSTLNLGSKDVSKDIRSRLATDHSLAPYQAELVYARIFLHVTQLISQKGEKKLTHPGLAGVLSLPELDATSAELLGFLKSEVLSHTARLNDLERGAARQETAVADLRMKLLEIEFGEQASINLTTAIAEISTELPPRIELSCDRNAVVSNLRNENSNLDWLAIHGSVGAGKTQLAALLGEQLNSVVYVTLRDLNSDEANFLLHHVFLQLCDQSPVGSITQSGLNALEVGTTFFLDDVPQILLGDKLSQRLQRIAAATAARSQTLVTLSHFPLPETVVRTLGTVRCKQILTPPLEVSDVIELFEKHQAPEGAVTKVLAASFVNSTSGNPTLLAAHAESLRRNNWADIEGASRRTEELVSTGEVAQQTLLRLLAVASESATRELLYRHCLVIGGFSSRETEVIADVEPQIARHGEHFSKLRGIWIENQAHDSFSVCPLIASTGARQLSKDVRQSVANSLADLIFDQKQLNPIDFSKAIAYLKITGDSTKLALNLLGGLESCMELPVGWRRLIFLGISDGNLLAGCPVSLALLVIARQVLLAISINANLDSLIAAGQRACSEAAPEDYWAVVGYAVQVGPQIADIDFEEGMKLCQFVLNHAEAVVDYTNERIGDPNRNVTFRSEELVSTFPWILTPAVSDEARFATWFDMVSCQTDQGIQTIFSSDMANQGMKIMLDRIWMNQDALPAELRDYTNAHRIYDQVVQFARQHSLPVVEAIATRSKIVVLAEYQKNLALADDTARPYLDNENDEVRFIINDVLGRQYRYSKDFEEAIKLLSVASNLDTGTFDGIRCRTFIELATAIGDTNTAKSLACCQSAIRIAKRNQQEVSELDLISTLGEAAIAAWLDNNHELTFEYTEEAFIHCERCKVDSVDWKMRFVFLGNALGYMVSMIVTGKPPSDDYAVPRRGHLISYNEAVANWYDDNSYLKKDLTKTLLVTFASVVGRSDRAVFWANNGLGKARAERIPAAIYSFAETLISVRLEEDCLDQALDLALEAAIAFTTSMVGLRRKNANLSSELSIGETLGAKPSDDWNQAEQLYIFLGLIPALTGKGCHGNLDATFLRSIKLHCENFSTTASNPSVFTRLVEAISTTADSWNYKPLHEQALKETDNENVAGASAMYILSSFAPDADLKVAVVQHLQVAYQYSFRISDQSLLWQFICEKMTDFWVGTFSNRRFLFSNPAEIERRLIESKELAFEQRFKTSLLTILSGLGGRIPKNLQNLHSWLGQQ